MTKPTFLKKLIAAVIAFVLITTTAIGFAIYALMEATENESVSIRILEESKEAKELSILLEDKLVYETDFPAGEIEVLPGGLTTINFPVDDDEVELTFILNDIRKDIELEMDYVDKIDVHITDESFDVNAVDAFNPVL